MIRRRLPMPPLLDSDGRLWDGTGRPFVRACKSGEAVLRVLVYQDEAMTTCELEGGERLVQSFEKLLIREGEIPDPVPVSIPGSAKPLALVGEAPLTDAEALCLGFRTERR